MMHSPLAAAPLFHLGPIPVGAAVLCTWILIALWTAFCLWLRRRLASAPGRAQVLAELFLATLEGQIRDTLRSAPQPFVPLVGGLFLFILSASLVALAPGVEAPTARIETDAALALVVFCAIIYHGVRSRGLLGYLKSFADPSWVMIPLNLVESVTRTFSLMVRLFGNMMSGAFILGILLSLAGLLVPIPFMALDVLVGVIQAYIFSVLTLVFIGAAIGEPEAADATPQPDKEIA